eukprot:scaffold87586_cov32-Tisochrysis_lutea.AAC.5
MAAVEVEPGGRSRGPAWACRHNAAHANGTLDPSSRLWTCGPPVSTQSAASSAAEPTTPEAPSPQPAGRICKSVMRPTGGGSTCLAAAWSNVASNTAACEHTSGRWW